MADPAAQKNEAARQAPPKAAMKMPGRIIAPKNTSMNAEMIAVDDGAIRSARNGIPKPTMIQNIAVPNAQNATRRSTAGRFFAIANAVVAPMIAMKARIVVACSTKGGCGRARWVADRQFYLEARVPREVTVRSGWTFTSAGAAGAAERRCVDRDRLGIALERGSVDPDDAVAHEILDLGIVEAR
ncbi:MAG: hypothetical protein R2710_01640 [Acidimicrobiales bacterium]